MINPRINSRLIAGSIALTLGTFSLGNPAWAQSQAPPPPPPDATGAQPQQPTDPAAASSPHQRDLTTRGATEAAPTPGADPKAASTPHQRELTGQPNANLEEGMAVQDRHSRESIGSVTKVIKGKGESQGYVLISTPDGMAVPVPSTVASSMAMNGKLLVDRGVLHHAPKVREGEFRDNDSHLKEKSAQYWAKHAS